LFRYFVPDVGGQLIVKVEFLNNEVKIVDKSIRNCFFYLVVKLCGNFFFFVAILQLEQPQV